MLFLNRLQIHVIIGSYYHNLTPTEVMELLTQLAAATRPNSIRLTARTNRTTAAHNPSSTLRRIHSAPGSDHAAKCTAARIRDALSTQPTLQLSITVARVILHIKHRPGDTRSKPRMHQHLAQMLKHIITRTTISQWPPTLPIHQRNNIGRK